MNYTSPGQRKTFAEFRAHWRAVAPELDADEVLLGADGPLGREIEIAGRRLANRFAIHPMEGWDGTAGGLPTVHTLRRWRNFGRSGAKLIWGGEAFAVQEDGRANPQQLYLNDGVDVAGGLAQLLAELRAGHSAVGEDPSGLFVGLQLTHSGRFARPDKAAPRIAWHNPRLAGRFGVSADMSPLSDGELEGIAARYVRAATVAHAVGFDFVDVKCCHGYLMHELLGATGREGPYGGSFENRTRLFRGIIEGIRSACPGLEIGVRVSIADIAPHAPDPESQIGQPSTSPPGGFGVDPADPIGIDLSEGRRFLALLQELNVRLVNLTLGSPYTCPHLQRPAAYPPSDGYQPPRDPLCEVATHIEVARACSAAFPELVFVGTGYTYLQQWLPHVAQHEVGGGHVDFVGLGRMALSYPELPLDVLRGNSLARKKICRTFSDCTTAPRNGLLSGCYPLDDHYRELPEAALLREIKQARP